MSALCCLHRAHLTPPMPAGFFSRGVSYQAVLVARGRRWLTEYQLEVNARALWQAAQSLPGVMEVLRARRAEEVRAQGGLLS